MKKVAEYKKKIVADLAGMLSSYPIVGVVNMENLPAPQLQRMRSGLRGSLHIFMTKKRLMRLAIAQVREQKPGIEKLLDFLGGMPAIIFTNENPFRLANELKKGKTAAPAKAGQTAPRDIVIPAGPTPFAPGPIISELGSIGLKTGVEAGKVSIKQDHVAVREGEKIGQKVANILSKLSIEPMEIGLNLVAVYEAGLIYGKDVLSLDQETFLGKLALAASESTAVALYLGYATSDTIRLLVAKASMEARHLAEVSNVDVAEQMAVGTQESASGEVSPSAAALTESTSEKKVQEEKASSAKEEQKAEVSVEIPKKQKIKGNVATTAVSGSEFKEDLAEEKRRREKIGHKEIEDLAQKLKQKGTFREG